MIVETEDLFYLIAGSETEDLRFVKLQDIGVWRWGNIYRLVAQRKQDGSFWAIDYRDSTNDDNYYNSLQDHLEQELKPAFGKEKVITEYSYGKE